MRCALGADEAAGPSSSSVCALDLLSGAVQASVIYIRIHSVDRLHCSIIASPAAEPHATAADENSILPHPLTFEMKMKTIMLGPS